MKKHWKKILLYVGVLVVVVATTYLATLYYFFVANDPKSYNKAEWAKDIPQVRGNVSYGIYGNGNKNEIATTTYFPFALAKGNTDVTHVLVARKDVENKQLADQILRALVEERTKKYRETAEKYDITKSYASAELQKDFIATMASPSARKVELKLQSTLQGADPALTIHLPLSKEKTYETEYTPPSCIMTDSGFFKCME